MDHPEKEHSDWPYSSLIILGFFGPDSPGGKKLVAYSVFALFLFIAGFIGTQILESKGWCGVSAAFMPVSVLILIYANSRYIKSLDTLEKLIQLSAFSASYGAALFIGFVLYALYLATGWHVSPLWLLLAEPFRGICLYFISKKYQ